MQPFCRIRYFNPRSPWGERQYCCQLTFVISGFQSTLSVRRATLYKYYGDCQLYWISIHALREESDPGQKWVNLFNIQFQSTLSVRRATNDSTAVKLLNDISIHALREESDTINGQQYSKKDISIHALREESDYEVIFVQLLQVLLISIHALREESDWTDRLFWF